MQTLIDSGTLIAYALLSLGIILQIVKIIKRKSVADIAVWEVMMRLLASSVILIKILTLNSSFLIIGQVYIVVIYFSYFLVVLYYRQKNQIGKNV